MRKRIFWSTLLVVTFAFTAPAQTAPAAAELTKLLNVFLAGASHNDVAMQDRFWADDVIYTGSAGRRRGKAEIMKDVRSAPTIESIAIGKAEFRNVTAVVRPQRITKDYPAVDGILGFALFTD